MLPAYLAKLWWRGRVEPLYRYAIRERFGLYGDTLPSSGWVWLHAVSLGETRAASALITALRAQRPAMRLLLTHGTATGRAAGVALLRPGDVQAWLPFDTPGSCKRFLTHFNPAIGVLMETEVWPNLLQASQQHGVPMVLANARLSERSAHRGDTLSGLMRPAAQSFALVLAQTQADANRLRAAGAPRVDISGNLKFDVAPDAAQLARGAAWRSALGRAVVLAASTRDGEEAALLSVWRQQALPRPLLVIVPRHPQRFDSVAGLLAGSEFTWVPRSSWQCPKPEQSLAEIDKLLPASSPQIPPGALPKIPPEMPQGNALTADVWLGDSIGEMAAYFGCANVALLGGSFEPLGGQNLIEAAACGCPLVMGPHTFNFAEAAEAALRDGAAQRANNLTDAVTLAIASTAVNANRDRAISATSSAPTGTSAGSLRGESARTTPTASSATPPTSAHALAFAARHRGAAVRMAAEIHALLVRLAAR